MKKAIIVLAIIIVGYYLLSSNKKSQEQQDVSRNEILGKEAAERHGASTDWDKDLHYTLQVQDKLLTDTPVLFKGYIEDIFRQDGKIYVRFASSIMGPTQYFIDLECDNETVQRIIKNDPKNEFGMAFLDAYFAVAKIHHITKPILSMVEIELDSSETIIGKGECLEFVFVGREGLFNE